MSDAVKMPEILPVEVITRDMSNGELIGKSVVIDHNDPEHRKWLGKHCFWAFRNNKGISTHPTHKKVTYKPNIKADEG